MNLLLIHTGIREQEIVPLLDIFNTLDIQVELHRYADLHGSDIVRLTRDFTHFLFAPSPDNPGGDGVIAYLCGYYQAMGNRVNVFRSAQTPLVPFLDHLNILSSMEEVRVCYAATQKEWEKKQKVEQAIQQLRNQGISFSEDSFFNIVRDGSIRAVELFLRAGMSYELRDRRGVSLLSHAVRNHHLAVVELLLADGADVNTIADDRGNSVLMDACSEGTAAICRCLLEAGADVNMRNKNNQTALILAIGRKSAEIAGLLLEYGADMQCRDNLGMSAVEYAGLFGMEGLFT
ncbi:MAG: ankyrin repeat domain-containing protein [Spirochaetales bacterium]|nr:ankyrin repeat domain-containing protein [Spirochaetales bacterium]